MALVRPRLTDHYGILAEQESVDFAIPFLDEDIPLYVDPFLLWKSPSMQDTSLHSAMISSFNGLGKMRFGKNREKAEQILINLSECQEAGLGQSRNKHGRRISRDKAAEILEIFQSIPDIQANGLHHIEEIQLLIDGISKDRISDFSCNLLKSFLMDYTIDQCLNMRIPMQKTSIENIYNPTTQELTNENVTLPINPETGGPIILIPKRWLRFAPWLSYEKFYEHACVNLPPGVLPPVTNRVSILNYNRNNYDIVSSYVKTKEREATDCKNDPLFKQIPITSAKTKWRGIKNLPTGKGDNADKKYEDWIEQLLASLLYPNLDYACGQSRTDSGAHIRDLIFYNNRNFDFLDEIFATYESRQIVFELKNVHEITREHINQLNRYLSEQFGRFGVIITRNPPPRHIIKNITDLWSGQRKCILVLTDDDIQTMVTVFESKQRLPIEILKRSYIDFVRKLPS